MTHAHVQFDDENAALAHLSARLRESLPPALARALAEQYVVRCQMEEVLDSWPCGPTEVDLSIVGAPLWGPWTIREEELRDLKELALGVIGAWTIPALHELVPLVISAACMTWRLRQNGVHLTPVQRDILVALRRRRHLLLDDLVVEASAFGTDWTTNDVTSTLAELASIRVRNGTVVALVHQAADGAWSTSGRVWEAPFGASTPNVFEFMRRN